MSDSSKYDIFLDEIASLEKMVQMFVVDSQDLEEDKLTLENKVTSLEKENEILVLKIKELDKKLATSEERSSDEVNETKLDLHERQNLKNQIDDLIQRIDYHIKS